MLLTDSVKNAFISIPEAAYRNLAMSPSSNATQQKQIVPASNSSFGQGYNFHYEKSFGNSWSGKRPFNFDQASEDFPSGDTAPRVIMPKPANDETELSACDRLIFATEVSIRYHNRRKQHYETAFRAMIMGVIILAASAFIFAAAQKAIFGFGIIALGVGTLVWNVTQKSREHDVLRNDYQSLHDQIRNTHQPDEKDVMRWRNTRLRTQSKEPAVYWAVANDCYYETARAWGLKPEQRGLPPVMLRPFMNWFRF